MGAIFLVILLSLAAAVGSNRPSCDQILLPQIPAAFAAPNDAQTAMVFMGELFGLPSTKMTSAKYVDGSFSIEFDLGNRSLVWNSDSRSLNVRWGSNSPTLGRVMECAGTPDFYQAETLPVADWQPYRALYLWYERSHLVVSVGQFGLPWGYTELQNVDVVRFVSGETWPERLELAFPRGSFPVMSSLRSLKRWPGSLAQVVVGTDPFMR